MLVVVAAACTGGGSTAGGPSSGPSSGPSVTATGRLDLGSVPVRRTPLCDLVSDDVVREALGGVLVRTGHYGNGDEFEVSPGTTDVSHEHGCVYEGSDRTAARVWVFARPVQEHEATGLVRRARSRRDCAFPDPLGFGSPGLTSVCEVPGADGTIVRARLEGLFSDTWVGCEVTEPLAEGAPSDAGSGPPGSGGTGADVVQRAVSWCSAVVSAAGAAS